MENLLRNCDCDFDFKGPRRWACCIVAKTIMKSRGPSQILSQAGYLVQSSPAWRGSHRPLKFSSQGAKPKSCLISSHFHRLFVAMPNNIIFNLPFFPRDSVAKLKLLFFRRLSRDDFASFLVKFPECWIWQLTCVEWSMYKLKTGAECYI